MGVIGLPKNTSQPSTTWPHYFAAPSARQMRWFFLRLTHLDSGREEVRDSAYRSPISGYSAISISTFICPVTFVINSYLSLTPR